jgi:glucose/arabinose dehydrogenase
VVTGIRATLGAALTAAACGGNAAPDAPRDDPDADLLACTPSAGTTVVGRLITTTPDLVTLVTAPAGDRRRFVVQRDGAIQIVEDDVLLPTPFLDLDDDVGGPVLSNSVERGLLGLAFHPDYAENGRFFVYYTLSLDNVVAEYRRMAGDDYRADPASGRVVLDIPDFANNHNGGMIEFGSDGYLYIATGDGGGAGDPQETAQDLDRLLGKMLRIDVDVTGGGREYGIPADNPYAAGGGAPEVFMYGLRNPWRWSFDAATGDIYIGDVGQDRIEEIDVVPAARARNADLGWDECEGSRDYPDGPGDPVTDCVAPVQPNRIRPVHERPQNSTAWTSVIGGQVYRGACFPALTGRYFFSDYGAGGLHSFVYRDLAATDVQEHDGFDLAPTSIHADGIGELVIGYGDKIVQIEAR